MSVSHVLSKADRYTEQQSGCRLGRRTTADITYVPFSLLKNALEIKAQVSLKSPIFSSARAGHGYPLPDETLY